MSKIADRLVRSFSAVFSELGENEIRKADVNSIPEWDSLATVTLFTVVEEEFKFEIEPEDLGRFTSFEAILEFIQNKMPLK